MMTTAQQQLYYCPECSEVFTRDTLTNPHGQCPTCGTRGSTTIPTRFIVQAPLATLRQTSPLDSSLEPLLRPVVINRARGLDPEVSLRVEGIEGQVVATQASFGGILPPKLSAPACLASPLSCESLSGAAQGRIVVCMRGGTSFAQKALVAQAAGAGALVIVQNNPDVWPFVPDDSRGAAPQVTLPVVALSHQAGTRLIAHLERRGEASAELTRVHDDERPCPICTESLLGDAAVVALPCQHLFHRACIGQWLVNSASCPNCRQPLAAPPKSSSDAAGWFG